MIVLAACAALAAAPAVLAPPEPVVVLLEGGGQVGGHLAGAGPGFVDVSTGDGILRLPLDQVAGARVDGFSIGPDELRAELEPWILAHAPPPDLPSPPPALVAGGSLLFPGVGQAILGRWGSALAYAVADSVVLGVASLVVLEGARAGSLVPLVAADIAFRGWSAAEAARAARARRRATPGGHHGLVEPDGGSSP